MPGIIDGLAAAERAAMLGDDPAIPADHDAVGTVMDLYWPSDCARRHRVFVVVLPHQAGLRD
jgi:hypothetical protein